MPAGGERFVAHDRQDEIINIPRKSHGFICRLILPRRQRRRLQWTVNFPICANKYKYTIQIRQRTAWLYGRVLEFFAWLVCNSSETIELRGCCCCNNFDYRHTEQSPLAPITRILAVPTIYISASLAQLFCIFGGVKIGIPELTNPTKPEFPLMISTV